MVAAAGGTRGRPGATKRAARRLAPWWRVSYTPASESGGASGRQGRMPRIPTARAAAATTIVAIFSALERLRLRAAGVNRMYAAGCGG